MKRSFLVMSVAFVMASAGCVTTSLERHTVNQSVSAATYRYEAALNCLAMVAADHGTLPSYALLSGGTVAVTNTGMASTTTTWGGAPVAFANQALSFTGTHAPQGSWNVSPVADFTQLEAMRCACCWVLDGQDPATLETMPILADPESIDALAENSTPGYHPHFGVQDRLKALPTGWLHVGRKCEAPREARYKARYKDTCVWVMPDGMEGLSGFTLVLQDIATLNVAPTDNSLPANLTPPVLVTLWSVESTQPKPSTVTITIKRVGNALIYPEKTEVTVGQSVIWQNGDSDGTSSHAATSTITGLFDTSAIAPGATSKPIVFDDAMFTSAGGYSQSGSKSSIEIEYSDKGGSGTKPKIVLKRSPYTGLYSPTLVFREDRVIKPCYLQEIRKRIAEQINNNPAKEVNITYAEWMEWTSPYQGQRAAAKPGASQAIPVLLPSRQVAPGAFITNINNQMRIVRPEDFQDYPGTPNILPRPNAPKNDSKPD